MKFTFSLILVPLVTSALFGMDGAKKISAATYPGVGLVIGTSDRCSVVVLGSQAVLTSAECGKVLNSNSPAWSSFFQLRGDGEKFTASCVIHPDYDRDYWNLDIAVCKTSKAMAGVQMAKVGTTSAAIGDQVGFVSYGAKNADEPYKMGGSLGFSWVFVTDVDKATFSHESIPTYGDAGAGFFNRAGDLVAIQADGAQGSLFFLEPRSLLLTGSDIRDKFLAPWAATNRVSICGITSDSAACTPLPVKKTK